MKTQYVYQRIAQLVCQNKNCVEKNNEEWAQRSRSELEQIAKDVLPSGSGVDCGTKIDVDASDANRLVLTFSYHHMNENGMYDGWTDHAAIVTPDLAFGFNVKITGKDRNGTKEYLHELYYGVLSEPCKS